MKQLDFKIKENSWQAKIAARKMRAYSVAMVLGKTIHLHNITTKQFLSDEKLLKHELCHVRQYQQHGYLRFIVKYLWQSLRKGYYNNKFELEARAAENE